MPPDESLSTFCAVRWSHRDCLIGIHLWIGIMKKHSFCTLLSRPKAALAPHMERGPLKKHTLNMSTSSFIARSGDTEIVRLGSIRDQVYSREHALCTISLFDSHLYVLIDLHSFDRRKISEFCQFADGVIMPQEGRLARAPTSRACARSGSYQAAGAQIRDMNCTHPLARHRHPLPLLFSLKCHFFSQFQVIFACFKIRICV